MGRFCILSGQINQYTKDGEEKTIINIQYFDPDKRREGQNERGYEILNRNIYPDHVLDDFKQLPGYYDLKLRQKAGFRGKGESKITEIEFEKTFNIKPCSQDKDAYLVLGIKKINFQPPGTTRKIKGIQCYFLDPLQEEDDELEKGFQIMQVFSSNLTTDDFPEVPGYYNLEFTETRGKNGVATSKLINSKLAGSLTNSQEQTSQTTVAA